MRLKFLVYSVTILLSLNTPNLILSQETEKSRGETKDITLFLCGDVMTGRGIDQVLPYPSDPQIHESYVRNSKEYVALAERVNGPIPKPMDFSYIWGDALKVLERVGPDVRIINLETSVTKNNDYWRGKGIHYRMHPKNIPCITAAKIDCCVLANNHVLDWGYDGLVETLRTLRQAGIKTTGAGHNSEKAKEPALIEVEGKGRVLVFSFGLVSSGIPREWEAKVNKSGVNLLPDLSHRTMTRVSEEVRAVKRAGDIVVASIHWGGNLGYKIPPEHIQFAHKLIDSADVNIIHGHSSHHAKGIEIYEDKPIIYGCGDFLNDYEGINGYEQYRDDLALMYFVTISAATGRLVRFEMVPTQIKRFRLHRASEEDTVWLKDILNRETKKFNTRIEQTKRKTLMLYW